MYKTIETVAIYQFITNQEIRFKPYPVDEAIALLKDWCCENNKDIYGEYIDIKDSRQYLDELLADAKKFKFSKVVVSDIKIFGRFRKDIRNIVYTLNSYGIEVEEVNSNKEL